MVKHICIIAAAALIVGSASAQTGVISNFDAQAVGAGVVFRAPGFSGSTSGNVEAGSTSSVIDSDAVSAPNSYELSWTWSATAPANARVRITTNNVAISGNPFIFVDNDRALRFDAKIVSGSVDIELLIRETGGSGPVGANAGTNGGIEIFAPAATITLDAAINSNWQSVIIPFAGGTFTGFAGATANGTFENGPWAALEALYVRRQGTSPNVVLRIDNLEVVNVASTVIDWTLMN